MIKVLIVDDEPKLREGLKSIVPWNELGFQVVDTAANGSEALDKFKAHAPDLMLVDIRMPGMDGLQLIEAIREKDPRVHMLILSGYADFDYAKKAISHRVAGYLLKPVDEDELSSYLLEIKEEIQKERSWEDTHKVVVEESREALIQTLLSEESHSGAELAQHAARLDLMWNYYQILLVHAEGEETANQDPERTLKELLNEWVEQRGHGAVFAYQAYTGVLLSASLHTEAARQEMYGLLDRAAAQAGLHITAAAGKEVRKLEDVVQSYKMAKSLIRSRFFYPPGELLSSYSKPFTAEDDSQEGGYDPTQAMDQLYFAVDVGHAEVQHSLIPSAAYAMVRDGYTEGMMKGAFMELLTGIFHKLTLHHPDLQSRTKEYTDNIAAVYRQRTVFELCQHAVDVLGELTQQVGRGSCDQEIKRILDLIERSYSENLKLETLATVFNYNSAYLGKVFKNTTGEYFNTYLDKVRISKAKEFLKQGMKVYQVAEKVGYTNVDYFHSKFKKYVGTSPSSYRKELKL
ncbi:response regulator transcription factor [Paenibacillus sp. FSL M8-0334]|uniref:response regulator transcription factor n=1 Tax=Paenibacillus sp. FSL M8-0334 TaxID=2921623 RepID=UPI0030F5A04F